MNTEEHGSKLMHRALTEQIIGAAFDVSNQIGHGFHEKPYENALVVEFGLRDLSVSQQLSFDINYKGRSVGTFIPDLIVEEAIVVDTKVIDSIGKSEQAQMMNYLRITGLRVGLILNFKHAKLEWARIVL